MGWCFGLPANWIKPTDRLAADCPQIRICPFLSSKNLLSISSFYTHSHDPEQISRLKKNLIFRPKSHLFFFLLRPWNHNQERISILVIKLNQVVCFPYACCTEKVYNMTLNQDYVRVIRFFSCCVFLLLLVQCFPPQKNRYSERGQRGQRSERFIGIEPWSVSNAM